MSFLAMWQTILTPSFSCCAVTSHFPCWIITELTMKLQTSWKTVSQCYELAWLYLILESEQCSGMRPNLNQSTLKKCWANIDKKFPVKVVLREQNPELHYSPMQVLTSWEELSISKPIIKSYCPTKVAPAAQVHNPWRHITLTVF